MIDYHFCVVGPLPPPRHGVSAVNEAMASIAGQAGFTPLRINTAPASLARSATVRVARIARIFNAFGKIRLFAKLRKGPIYFSLSGGIGLIWESLLALEARLLGCQVVVHHHSFRYIDCLYYPMLLLIWAAGTDATHIALSQKMGDRLSQTYPSINKILVVGNAKFVGVPINERFDLEFQPPEVVGLLANLSTEKGLDDFLDLADECLYRALPWKFVLAGPFECEAIRRRVISRITKLTNLTYVGPLYEAARDKFFREIDIFVFPTRYRNEAEPLVVLEAMRHGCPVIAFGRGCIPETIGESGGVVVPIGEDFVTRALTVLESWRREGGDFSVRKTCARNQFVKLYEESVIAIENFFCSHLTL